MSNRLAILVFALAGLVPPLALAAGSAWAEANEDEAHQALERGDIRPLEQVLDVARKRLPGEIIKIKLEHDDGRWTYEIKILTDTGERREIEIDARDLRVLDVD